MQPFLLALALQANSYSIAKLDLSEVHQGWGEPQIDRSVDRHTLSIGGQKFTSGLGTHAESDFLIDLHQSARRFTAKVGVDDESEKRGSISFEVWLDGKKRFDSGVMRGGQSSKPVNVDLTGAKQMRLHVTDGGDDINYDHADWAEAIIEMNPGAKAPAAVKVPVEPPIKIAMSVPSRAWIHGPRVIGCTAGKPFLFRVPVSGQRPITYSLEGKLPIGLILDKGRGIISGSVKNRGVFHFAIRVRNGSGEDRRDYSIDSNGLLALTPPLGWNSWNVWGTHVDADKVRASADAFVKEGFADFGYANINIDDAWEGSRDANGNIQTNSKFGDMHPLADYIHGLGLKIGIYSSPGPQTCGGYEGSYSHEQEDANTYADWGIDYLKYDWCSYGNLAPRPDLKAMKAPYSLMSAFLKKSKRDIVFSLCQYGMGDVYKWGGQVGGNLWRTTGDIGDSWTSMSSIGFDHSKRSPYVKPGGWNDPDMLVVGRLGWGPSPRPTRLTPNEQITHITLWSMLAAPFLIGCDLTNVDPFTKAILCNHEVIEIDQDPLGKAAIRKSATPEGLEVWSRPLRDGSVAVALFNRSLDRATVTADWKSLGISGNRKVMDCWQMKSIGVRNGALAATVPAHGAMLFKLSK